MTLGRPPSLACGMRFGRLVIVGQADEWRNGERLWECQCDCGNSTQVVAYSLKRGATKSCGCLRNEVSGARFREMNTTHGQRYNSLRHPWGAMIQRCTNPNHPQYHNYGERGVTVCERWLGPDGLGNFIADMGEKPSPQHSLDRVDNDGNYEPENCRWSTPEEQVNNRRPWREWRDPRRPKYLQAPCPKCGARFGEFCHTPKGKKRKAHKTRQNHARRLGIYPRNDPRRGATESRSPPSSPPLPATSAGA